MAKKLSLLGVVILLLLLLVGNVSAAWIGLNAQAQVARGVEIQDIEDLSGLEVDFGGSQNSLLLKLKGDETQTLTFALDRLSEPYDYELYDYDRGRHALFFYYQAEFPANLAYSLSGGESRPSTCEIEPLIYINPGLLEQKPSLNGYRQIWRNYDLGGQSLTAQIKIPLLNAATTQIRDDCFLLETEITFQSSRKPLFSLAGSKNFDNSCAGLEIYGRGGDNLEAVSQRWICYDDAGLTGEARDQFAQIDTPPFDRSYVFIEHRDEKCGSRLLVDADDIDSGELELSAEWQDFHDECKKGQYNEDEDSKKIVSLEVANGSALIHITPGEEEPGVTTPSQATNNGQNGVNQADIGLQQGAPLTNNASDTCEFHLTGVVVGWLLCWVFNGISGVLNFIESFIGGYLTLEPEDYKERFQSGENATYKDVWRAFRDFMTLAVVGTALFMVISTALDIGFFKNYTVKKYMPRLVAGTILIQFSWTLGDFAIQATNQMGDLLKALMFSAVPEAINFGLNNILDGGGITVLLVSSGGVVAAYFWLGLLSIGLTAAGAFFFGFLFLVARKFLIIFLLILSPLGLALWILPGNDKAWRFYAKTFLYLLLFYPVIVMVISAGKIFAYLILLP